jgi:hypothetical protein
VISVVKGLEGPLQKTMLQAGRNMSQGLIKGAAEGADDPINQAGFGGLTNHVMLQAVRGARQGMTEGLPDQAQVALISGMVLLGALVLAASGDLTFFWWRYQQSTNARRRRQPPRSRRLPRIRRLVADVRTGGAGLRTSRRAARPRPADPPAWRGGRRSRRRASSGDPRRSRSR